MAQRPSLDDYVDVAERIQDFKDAHPDGCLQTSEWGIKDVNGAYFIYYAAEAYRAPDDDRPGQGIAWEPFPGRTPYTKDSELMNAETAAWGRAICALGLVSNRKLASRQEVRNRVEDAIADERPAKVTAIKKLGPDAKKLSKAQVNRLSLEIQAVDPERVQLYLNSIGAFDLPDLTPAQANELVKAVAA